MKNSGLRFWILLGVLVVSGIFLNAWSAKGEAHIVRSPLAKLPGQLGAWQRVGGDDRFDKEAEAVLRADDYLVRNYALPATTGNGSGANNNFSEIASVYVGYYATQRSGATYHSPLNCLPGSGWVMTEPQLVRVTPADGAASFDANRYIIQRGDTRQLMLYWYQGRGRATASEYRDKLNTVMDSIARRRSDGAMVRLLLPIKESEEATLKAATNLAASLTPALPNHVPN